MALALHPAAACALLRSSERGGSGTQPDGPESPGELGPFSHPSGGWLGTQLPHGLGAQWLQALLLPSVEKGPLDQFLEPARQGELTFKLQTKPHPAPGQAPGTGFWLPSGQPGVGL